MSNRARDLLRAALSEQLNALAVAHVVLNHRAYGLQLTVDNCFCEVGTRHREIRAQFEQLSLDVQPPQSARPAA